MIMKTHEFTIIATGLDPFAEGFEDRFFEAGCDDATISFQKGVIILEFSRDARSFVHALMSALRDVRRAGAKVERFEPDDLVSLADIAKRTDLSRAAVTHYAKGERRENFPPPVARVTSESPLWDWVDVARWLHRRHKISREVLVRARLVKELNVAVSAQEIEHGHLARRIHRGLEVA